MWLEEIARESSRIVAGWDKLEYVSMLVLREKERIWCREAVDKDPTDLHMTRAAEKRV